MSGSDELDIFSDAFDARRALLAEKLAVPYPEVQPLNNLSECRRLLPESSAHALPKHLLNPPRRLSAAPAAASGRRLDKDARRELRTAERFASGPLVLLKQLIRQRVCVVTRHASTVRGVCTGILVAADRHLNLVLLDAVDTSLSLAETQRPETLARPVDPTRAAEPAQADQAAGAGAPSAAHGPGASWPDREAVARALRLDGRAAAGKDAPASAPVTPLRRRYGQLFVKGESVVLVYREPSAQLRAAQPGPGRHLCAPGVVSSAETAARRAPARAAPLPSALPAPPPMPPERWRSEQLEEPDSPGAEGAQPSAGWGALSGPLPPGWPSFRREWLVESEPRGAHESFQREELVETDEEEDEDPPPAEPGAAEAQAPPAEPARPSAPRPQAGAAFHREELLDDSADEEEGGRVAERGR